MHSLYFEKRRIALLFNFLFISCLSLITSTAFELVNAEESDVESWYSEIMVIEDMWEELDCEDIFEYERPIHSLQTWESAREFYREIVGEESTITSDASNGFFVPVEAKQAPPKGRGIFAQKDISVGELVWSTQKTARFEHASDYCEFIFGLEEGFACDVLQWGM